MLGVRLSDHRIDGYDQRIGSQYYRSGRCSPKKTLCMCYGNINVPKPGVQTSFWEPYRAVEFVRQSGCSQVLNGVRFPFDKLNQGTGVKQSAAARAENEGHGLSFRHYHYYSFPAMYMLDMFLPMNCNPGGYVDLDAIYFSELDPTWNHDEIAFFTHSEAALFATPLTAVSCIPDALAVGFNKPMKDLYWCAGAWGAIFPTSGHVTAPRSILGSTSLMTTRVLYQLHRREMEWRSMGDDAMCGGRICIGDRDASSRPRVKTPSISFGDGWTVATRSRHGQR